MVKTVRVSMTFNFPDDISDEQAIEDAEREFYDALGGDSWDFDPDIEVVDKK